MKGNPSKTLFSCFTLSTLRHWKEIASLIEIAAHAREMPRIVRAVKLTMPLKRKLKLPVCSAFLKFVLTLGSEANSRLLFFLPKHNVIRTGLRNICVSYSCIWLADVAKKLRLNSANPVAYAKSIVAKAIQDGAIDVTVDHANEWMVGIKRDQRYLLHKRTSAGIQFKDCFLSQRA